MDCTSGVAEIFSERGWLQVLVHPLSYGPSADAKLWVLKPDFALHLLLTLDKLVSIPEPLFPCL